MRPFAIVVLLAALAAGCGGNGGDSAAGSESQPGKPGSESQPGKPGAESQPGKQKQGLSLSVSFDEPLRTGQPVTWTLQVENGGPDAATLVFRSGKNGDVALVKGGQEVYRWSSTRYFSQAMRQERLEPGERKDFPLEENSFSIEAGDYELVAELDSEPAPPAARRSVTVTSKG